MARHLGWRWPPCRGSRTRPTTNHPQPPTGPPTTSADTGATEVRPGVGSTFGRAPTRTACCSSSCSSPYSRRPCSLVAGCCPGRAGFWMLAVAPAGCFALLDGAIQRPTWSASIWPDGWWRPPSRPLPPGWRSGNVQGRAERLPFPDDRFDLVFATLSLRHWADLPAGIAEVARVLGPGGTMVLADIFPSCPRRAPWAPMARRRRHPLAPAELEAVLARQRLEVAGVERARWFGLPDVQVLAVQPMHPPTRRQSASGGAAGCLPPSQREDAETPGGWYRWRPGGAATGRAVGWPQR